jgi:hypothetical protein
MLEELAAGRAGRGERDGGEAVDRRDERVY